MDISNTRYCSDRTEFQCEVGEKLHLTFTLDCSDCGAISRVVHPPGYSGGDIRDVMSDAIEQRLGICSTARSAADDTTLVQSAEQRHGGETSETMKRCYIRHMLKFDRPMVLRNLEIALEHYTGSRRIAH